MDSVIFYVIALVVAILVVVAAYVIVTYNRLVGAREFVRNAMGQIGAQVESRWDAITSLIAATKRYSEHESSVIERVTRERGGINLLSSVSDVERDDVAFAGAMGRINALAEEYPELKASGVYQNAMNQIGQFENNVRASRMIFNDSVTKYNRIVLQFPSSLVARPFGFCEYAYFENADSKSQMPSWQS
ncbi:MAG: LemA family protein [Actinomycetaceae bacterium]|nr:LemA family protein [Arcanobacterium sp.]MDD7687525.1 LemA family protein [Actinomycetaceae bacterium]MDY5272999.1 LemA family protein [Arcanobacterium sp.]